MARKIRGYKWEMNYRGFNIYYSAEKNQTIAQDGTFEIIASTDNNSGEIFGLVDAKLEMMGL
jgi:hypothetical protein